MSLSRAVERLMALDTVIAERDLAWLATEQDKVAHFTRMTMLGREQLPHQVFRSGRAATGGFPRQAADWGKAGRDTT
jgi:hypothetical protein